MACVEIERKWLLDGFPNETEQGLELLYDAEMQQGYLSFEPVTVRIRCTRKAQATERWLAIKGKGTLARTEVELPLSEEQYTALLQTLPIPPVRKQFRAYRLPGGEILECSHVDEGEPTAFYYAEVEFATEQAAHAFAPPPFLGREVTEEPGWTMAAYCRKKNSLAEM